MVRGAIPSKRASRLQEDFDLTTTSGVYTFEVFGPNGFVRKFAGNTSSNAQTQGRSSKPSLPEVRTQYDVANGNVFLKFSNKGGGIARLTVNDNAYGARPRQVLVPAGARDRRGVGAGVEPSLVRPDGQQPGRCELLHGVLPVTLKTAGRASAIQLL